MDYQLLIKQIKDTYSVTENWAQVLDQNFPRSSSGYNTILIEDFELNIDSTKYLLPKRITLLDEYFKGQNDITTNHLSSFKEKQCNLTIKKKYITLGLYKRDNNHKYSGSLSEVLSDIFKGIIFKNVYSSTKLEDRNQNLLYSLNSNLHWNSYLYTFETLNDNIIGESNKSLDNDILSMLSKYGFNIENLTERSNIFILILPIPYVRIIENRINIEKDYEFIKIILEKNYPRLAFIQFNISVKCIIKDINKQIVLEKTLTVDKKDYSKYAILEFRPEHKCKIGWSEISVCLNDYQVDGSSGAYLRQIKIETHIK